MNIKMNKEKAALIICLLIILTLVIIETLTFKPITIILITNIIPISIFAASLIIILGLLTSLVFILFENKIGYYISFIIGFFILLAKSILIYKYLFTSIISSCYDTYCFDYEINIIPKAAIILFTSILLLILSIKLNKKILKPLITKPLS